MSAENMTQIATVKINVNHNITSIVPYTVGDKIYAVVTVYGEPAIKLQLVGPPDTEDLK